MKTWREECGVFGIWNHPEASRMAYLGLYALQHRGQESAGVVSLELQAGSHHHHVHKGLGLVADIFDEDNLDRLKGRAAIGHNRYSTSGANLLINAQPLTAHLKFGLFALAHNGNIVNASILRERLRLAGAIFQGTNDTEVILHLLARAAESDIPSALEEVLKELVGAYSLVMLSDEALIVARDPLGFRPLCLGTMRNTDGTGKTYVVASETCAFDLIGASLEREIEPGEIVWINNEGVHSRKVQTPGVSTAKRAQCVFEHVYFSRPDSVVFGRGVYESRRNLGAELAREQPIEADIVVPVPDSGTPAALGYSRESGIAFEMGIIRNHYIGRTFIEPKQAIRSFGVKVKLNAQMAVLKGRRVVVVDDSLVRGTTCRKIIEMVRAAGAREVHLRIAAPPTVSPCYYGVDTPRKSELIAAHSSVEEIRDYVKADSLAYLSHDGLLRAVRGQASEFCSACFGTPYPTPLFGSVR